MEHQNNDTDAAGVELFENYLAAKNALVNDIKRVVEILVKCNALDVTPAKATAFVSHKLDWISSHQWMYSKGHDTIYCQHTYKPDRFSSLEHCVIRIPLAMLGKPDKEVYGMYIDSAIAELKNKRHMLETELKKASAPINKQIDEIDNKISDLLGE